MNKVLVWMLSPVMLVLLLADVAGATVIYGICDDPAPWAHAGLRVRPRLEIRYSTWQSAVLIGSTFTK